MPWTFARKVVAAGDAIAGGRGGGVVVDIRSHGRELGGGGPAGPFGRALWGFAKGDMDRLRRLLPGKQLARGQVTCLPIVVRSTEPRR